MIWTNKVKRFISSQNLIETGERILVAVSGGADSMAMLDMLAELGYTLEAAHFNHKIRGDEAERDESFVRDYCQKHEICCHIGSADVPEYARANKLGLEEAARILRYEFLQSTAKCCGADKIATAHNARDNAETVLMNLCRGASLRGVCGINPKRANIIRPILCLDRAEIEQYLSERKIPNVLDSTNLSPEYSRNKMRSGAIEKLEEYSAGFADKMLEATLIMREDEELLIQLTREQIPDDGVLSAKKLAELPAPIARRIIAQMSKGASRVHIEKAIEMAKGESVHARLSFPKTTLYREYDKMYFGETKTTALEDTIINIGDTIFVGEFAISCKIGIYGDKKDNNSAYLCFKRDKVCGKISFGSRKIGDTLTMPKRMITKSLKKLYSEAKIPPSEREKIPVFRDEKGVIGVCGFGVDKRVSPNVGDEIVIIEALN